MWEILEKNTLQKGINKIPKEILKRYEVWKRIVELEGPDGLKKIRGFNDESLKGKWKGYRSSRLNYKWRVLYKLEGKELLVYVIDINPHKY